MPRKILLSHSYPLQPQTSCQDAPRKMFVGVSKVHRAAGTAFRMSGRSTAKGIASTKQLASGKISPSKSKDSEQNSGGGGSRFSELSMFLVAAFWGTNPVCLRYIYRLQENPSPACLAAIQSCGGALLLTIITFIVSQQQGNTSQSSPQRASESQDSRSPGDFLGDSLGPQGLTQAGLELGFWTFLGNAATISGFASTPASRGAFLIRLTAVFTPIVSKAFGNSISNKEWAASAIALVGGVLISVDSALKTAAPGSDAALGIGDALLVLSALLWSLQTVRLSKYAKTYTDSLLPLSRNLGIGFGACSALWFISQLIFSSSQGDPSPTGSLFSGNTDLSIWAATFWPAIGPWGLAAALQVNAQKTVSAPRAQIIMATDPIWATFFAGILGGSEQGLGGLGYAGAACVVGASIVAK